MIKNICIIGAGFSGISTARTLKALNYGITVYEKEPDVGGVWAASRRYPGVNTQDSKSTYALPDYPMPDDYLYTQRNSHAASLWLADYLHDGVKLPTTEQQNHSIDERLAWLEVRTKGKHSKGTSMIPFLQLKRQLIRAEQTRCSNRSLSIFEATLGRRSSKLMLVVDSDEAHGYP